MIWAARPFSRASLKSFFAGHSAAWLARAAAGASSRCDLKHILFHYPQPGANVHYSLIIDNRYASNCALHTTLGSKQTFDGSE